MNSRALCTPATHFDFTGRVIIREGVTCFADANPQDIFSFAVVGHDFYWLVIVFSPKDSTCKRKRNFFDVTSVVVCTSHDTVDVCTKLLNFCNSQSHSSPLLF